MKKNQFVKFSLTVVCAAVLAACSSGGGNDDAAKRAAEQAAAEKAAAEKAAAEKAAAEKAAAEKAAKAEAELQNRLATTGDEGAKSVKKTLSNLVTNNVIEARNYRSSDSITGMTVALYPTLDTIVVATPVDANGNALKNAAQIYLEDFDFRGNDRSATTALPGRYLLKHIHNINETQADKTKADDVLGKTIKAGQARPGDINPYTKTTLMGTQDGMAFVYENGRLNYTKKVESPDVLDKRIARTEFLGNGTAKTTTAARLDDSVAEVYGYRTFVAGDSVTGRNGTSIANSVAAAQAEQYKHSNAPFQATGVIANKNTNATAADSGAKKVAGADAEYTAAGKLNYVQYGRVTSKLDQIQVDDLREGKNIVTLGTKIGSFGGYGDEGTEDHYFYRGVVSLPYDANLKTKLGQIYGTSHTDAQGKTTVNPAGVLDYRGHAVTYNLDRNLNLGDKVPNAIGYTQQLVSGTHVNANINLSSGAVTGRLYNVWEYSNGQETNTVSDNLANFSGSLANNGSIVGTANKLSSTGTAQSTGTLVASLFGPQAQELGGTIKSKDTYNSWGASFGASVQNVGRSTEDKTVPAIGESTDQSNVNNPNVAK